MDKNSLVFYQYKFKQAIESRNFKICAIKPLKFLAHDRVVKSYLTLLKMPNIDRREIEAYEQTGPVIEYLHFKKKESEYARDISITDEEIVDTYFKDYVWCNIDTNKIYFYLGKYIDTGENVIINIENNFDIKYLSDSEFEKFRFDNIVIYGKTSDQYSELKEIRRVFFRMAIIRNEEDAVEFVKKYNN